MGILLLALNIILVLSSAILALSLLKVRDPVGYLAGLLLLGYADIVLVLECAGLMFAVMAYAVLGLQIALTALAAVAWMRAGRPSLRPPIPDIRPSDWFRDRASTGKSTLVIALALVVAYVYLRDVLAILAVAPNNYDSLTYHLSRVGYWHQYHSLFPWPTPNPRQTSFPINAELGFLWTVLWWGTDRLTAFIQWLTVPFIALIIFGLSRILGYSRWSAALTALLWATLTQVIFQATSTQNDLVTAAFWIAAVFFFIRGLRQRGAGDALLSGLAFGLAMGTKGTSFIFLPGFGLAVLLLALPRWRDRAHRRHALRWLAACALGLTLFGSYTYLQNLVAYGQPLGPATANTGGHLVRAEGGTAEYASRLRDNLGRYAYQAVDFSPLPRGWAEAINPAKAAIFARLFQWLRIPVENPATIATRGFALDYINPINEDRSWFGPLAMFLVAAAILQIYQGFRKRDSLRLGLVVMGFGFVVVESMLEEWTPYKGRYFAMTVAVLFPFMASLMQTRRVWQSILAFSVVAVGATAAMGATLNMPDLHGIEWRDALRNHPTRTQGPQEFEYLVLQRNQPAHASVGLTGGGNFADYPFFGEGFTHFVSLDPRTNFTSAPRIEMRRYVADFQQSDYLFLRSRAYSSELAAAPAGFDLMSADGTYSVWIRGRLRPADKCEGRQWPFSDFFRQPEDPVVCPRFPFGPPRAPDTGSGPFYLRNQNYFPAIAAGDRGTMVFDLLAKRDVRARILVRVDPEGFTVPQTLELRLSRTGMAPQVMTARFSGKDVLRFDVVLIAGTYTTRMRLADGPLEVRIRGIEVVER